MDLVLQGHGIWAAWKEYEFLWWRRGRLEGGFREQSSMLEAWRQTAMMHWVAGCWLCTCLG